MDNVDIEYSLSKLYSNLGSSLIEATPEHWNSAILHMETKENGVSHYIESDEGHSDIVMCTDEIIEASCQVIKELEIHNKMYKKATLRVWLSEESKWKFEFER